MNKKERALWVLKRAVTIIAISIIIELLIVLYNFTVNKFYEKFHFIGNQSIEINKEDIEIIDAEQENNYYLKVSKFNVDKIYNISLTLNDKNQEVYLRVIFNNDAKFMPKDNKNGSKFKVYFISGMETNEFSLVYTKGYIDINKIERITINDNIDYLPNIEFSIPQTLIIFSIITIIYTIVKLYKFSNGKERKIKKEFIFLGLSLFIGITFTFINVPQIRYDEHAHYWRTYEIASGHIISHFTNEMPTSVIDLLKRKDGSYPNREFNYKTLEEKLNQELNLEDNQQFSVGATGANTPISYLPQLIGTFIGYILKLNPVIIFWLGRLTNLLAYIAIVFIAIKIIPSEKWKAIIMLIALLPMSMNLAATFSPDTVIIGVTLLAISYALNLKFKKEKINTKNIALLSILCLIPMICKITYFPLFLIILILPKEKFESRTKRILSYIVSIGIMILPYILINKISHLGESELPLRTNMIEQCIFAASDLIRDFGTVINTIYTELNSWVFETIGGWNTLGFITIIIVIILVFEMFIKDEENEKYIFSKKDKIICSIIIAIESLSIIVGMYLAWTEAHQTIIDGVQGRYFLPIIPLICIVFGKNKIECKIKNKEIKYILFSIILYCIIFGFSIRAYLP